ncbi:PREDICTED: uncharacterized protein LOC109216716 [Nicotiana attenuata]|uniref:uncharacterized protein LOC109216716 n=1 Tax=Nicotiana attenuata TaxID=49451 RepID=UPI00090594A5|nr:PREDICTED: uncharacterized protein LOC109216716 [Nicotiana attenuata]
MANNDEIELPPPQGPSEGTSTIPQATQPPLPAMSDHILPPGYVPNYSFHTVPGISNAQPSATSVRNTPLIVSGLPVYTIPPPNLVTRPNIESLSHVYDGEYYSPDMSFKGSAPHSQTPQYVLPAENKKAIKTVERDEMVLQPAEGAGGKEKLLMAYFGESLVGVASEWFIDQDISHWHVWDDTAHTFVKQFQYNIDIAPDHNSLSNIKKKPTESFREYAVIWREQASRVKPPMDDHELITIFLQAQGPDYFQNMMAAMGRPFADAIKIGEMVENGLNTGRIISQAALKAATKEIQNRPNSCVNQKKKDEEAMMASRAKRGQKGTSQPSNPRYSVAPQYATQSFAKPSNCQHMQAPTLTYLHPRHQNFQSLYNARPKQECEWEHKRRDNFMPIVESYTSLFERLKRCGMIEPLQGYVPDPYAKGFDPAVRCMYHSNVQGYSIEGCRALKREIEKIIQEGMIVVQDNGTLNVMTKHALFG